MDDNTIKEIFAEIGELNKYRLGLNEIKLNIESDIIFYNQRLRVAIEASKRGSGDYFASSIFFNEESKDNAFIYLKKIKKELRILIAQMENMLLAILYEMRARSFELTSLEERFQALTSKTEEFDFNEEEIDAALCGKMTALGSQELSLRFKAHHSDVIRFPPPTDVEEEWYKIEHLEIWRNEAKRRLGKKES